MIIFLYILAIVLGLTVGAPLVVFSITITIIAIVKSVKKKKADKAAKSVVPTQQYEPIPSDLANKYSDMFSDFDVRENADNTKATDSSGLTFFDDTDNQDVTVLDGNTAETSQNAPSDSDNITPSAADNKDNDMSIRAENSDTDENDKQ